MAKIIPGILTGDEEDYRKRLRVAEHVSDILQVDILDGKFANNKTVGIETVRKNPSSSSLEVQLMVVTPEDFIKELLDLNFVYRIIFPYETEEDIGKNIYEVKKSGKKVGLSINPETPVSSIASYADDIDVLCIFSASPGFTGQKLQSATYERIKESKKLFGDLAVEVDIGVNFETAVKLAKSGADFLVATSVLRDAPDYRVAYEKLEKLAKSGS